MPTKDADKAREYRQRHKESRLRYYREVSYPKAKERIKINVKRRQRERKYGVSQEQFDALLLSQNGSCRICKTTNPGVMDWCVDHDHITNKVRGLLCSHCNLGLGHFRDNPEILRAAALYLEFNAATN